LFPELQEARRLLFGAGQSNNIGFDHAADILVFCAGRGAYMYRPLHAQTLNNNGGGHMKLMVVKAPRFMSGILRIIFRVKDK